MATKVVCDRCGKDVKSSDTQLVIKIASIVGKNLLLFKEKDYCAHCYGIVISKIENIIEEIVLND